jgi:UDP-glucose 4-epimerase
VRVLVTGGAGFIGTALCRRLAAEGHQAVVADLNPAATDVDAEVTADLRDPGVVARALQDVDAVAHLAAFTSVLKSIQAPHDVYRSNVAVTHEILEGCRERGLGPVVFASTNAVVGTGAGEEKINESSPLTPLTPYGATKAAAEMLLSSYRHAYGVPTVALRLTNVYGPGMWVKDTMVARIMKAARGGTGIRIHGDGLLSRDYVYLDDVIDAFMAGLGLSPGVELPQRIVIGSGASHSVLDLHRLACQATGVDIPAGHVEGPAGEMRAVVVDRSLADEVGLAPPRSLVDGLRATWDAWPADAVAS